MSLTAPELTGRDPRFDVDIDDVEGPWVNPLLPSDEDVIVVTCSACGAHQDASGRAPGYTCDTCGSVWQVLGCPGCHKASIVAEGERACPRCGHDHRAGSTSGRARMPSWLIEPDPLSVWLGGVKYLGGHAERDRPSPTAGLLLDRRGVHLRAFAELFSIPWDRVVGIDIEGPIDISERLTTSHLLALGASTWAMQVAYLTVHTPDGDAIFEIDGLGPPELHARLSRVLQGLQRSERPPAPIAIERGQSSVLAPTVAAPVPAEPRIDAPLESSLESPHEPIAIDPETSDAPLEILVVDALWKLTQLRERGIVDDTEAAALRARILTRVPGLAPATPGPDGGPLLHV